MLIISSLESIYIKCLPLVGLLELFEFLEVFELLDGFFGKKFMAVDFLVCIPLLVLFGVFVEDFFAGFVVFFCFFGFLFPVFFGVLFEFAAFVAPFSFFGVLSRVFVRLFLVL